MIYRAISIAVGIFLFQQMAFIPPFWVVLVGLAAVVLSYRMQYLQLPAIALLGFVWANAYALTTEPAILPDSRLGADLMVTGVVTDLPDKDPKSTKFLFEIQQIEHEVLDAPLLVRLSWYRGIQDLRADELWRLRVRLKPARGFMNPGSFDYAGWLYRKGVRYTGYVRDHAERLGPSSGQYPLSRWRQAIADHIGEVVSSPTSSAILRALVVGDRSQLQPSDWELFRQTGTNHLVAISGLHIGLVAAFFFGLTNLSWRRVPFLCRRWPAVIAASLVALVTASIYAAMAGFSIPTQRALIMLLVAVIAIWSRRTSRPMDVLAMAFITVLIWDPTAILAQGFWLSFSAVAVILYVMLRLKDQRPVIQWLWLQVFIAIGLMPLLLFYYQQMSLISPLVNLLAIPWYGFVIVPTALAATALLPCCDAISHFLFSLADWALDASLEVFRWLSSGPFTVFSNSQVSEYAFVLAILGIMLLLSPRGVPARYLSVVMFLPLLLGHSVTNDLKEGDFRLSQLDVGQGLAALVETRTHLLVYDTGPRFRSGFNTGDAVLIPVIDWLGGKTIDLLMVSHADTDHSGGAEALIKQLGARDILAGEPHDAKPLAARPCEQGQSWVWDGVRFDVLSPPANHHLEGNNASCVLRVSSSAGSALLTGDIESAIERRLIRETQGMLAVDLILVPHHGSNSSSIQMFVDLVQARYALFATGYRNHYGFPKQRVSDRWSAAGATLLNSAEEGMIQVRFDHETGMGLPSSYRRSHRRYWHTNQ